MTAGKLTPKQQAFVAEYLRNGRNAAAAYRSCYATKGSAQHVAACAHTLLKHPEIAHIVREADAIATKRLNAAAQLSAVTKERISHELARIAFADPTLLPDGERVPLRIQQSALMDLARLHGLIVERKDVRIIKSVADLSDTELAALVAEGEREDGGSRH